MGGRHETAKARRKHRRAARRRRILRDREVTARYGESGHRQCGRKMRYPRERDARAQISRLQACGLAGYLRAYECPLCGGWHLTSKRVGVGRYNHHGERGDMPRFATARELFEAAREAAMDAERCRRQLARMDAVPDIPPQSFEPRVRSTPDPDRIGRAVTAHVDMGERLRRRQDDDYRLIDSACEVLYGTDSDAGLWALVGWPADAIYHHYLALRTWDEVADMLGYDVRHVLRRVSEAFDTADANGHMWTVLGQGFAT